ncbi:DUF4215 domain-containing protein [Candidatus Woesearchaeota archaeon]|nr:DUF4215 domain-containing protein [Candidatus Woesearchaeota archaeon]
MKNKILLLVSLFVILLFVVSCAPKMSDEELQAELSKLSPEEREAVMAEDSGTFAGMAKASPKLTTLRAAYQSSGLKKKVVVSGTVGTSVNASGSANLSVNSSGNASAVNLSGNLCGDGKINYDSSLKESDECDDGNLVNGDGCSSTCKEESGWQHYACLNSSQESCMAKCGDGKKEAGEECDDGNAGNSDGCSSTCKIVQQQQVCTPNQYVCDSALYKKQCKSDGSGYNTSVKCAEGEMCSNGNCVASLQKPDLVVGNVSFSLVFNATSGKNDVMYNVTLKNTGGVNSGFFNTKVQPMVNGTPANSFGGTLAAGKESSTIGKYQGELICPGTHTLNVTADINWQVAESNEDNNQALSIVAC